MPLSEHEQRLLSQLEEQLLVDDPHFATTMRGTHGRSLGRRVAVGVVGVISGIALLMVALLLKATLPVTVVVGLLGFGLMLAAAIYALSPAKKMTPEQSRAAMSPPAQPDKKPGSFMQRMEQRWDRRRDDF